MSNINNEVISELVDGEHARSDMLDHLIGDEEKREIWYRYHLIGDCLRGNLSEPMTHDVAGKVKSSLANEPVALSPGQSKHLNIKPIVGFALAASVAAVAVFSVNKANEAGLSAPAPAVVKRSDSLDDVANQRLNNYLVNHNEYRSNGSINGIFPYVRIVTVQSRE